MSNGQKPHASVFPNEATTETRWLLKSMRCIDELLADKRLKTWQATPDDRIDADSDEINSV